MNDRFRTVAAVGFTVALFLGVQVGALALVDPFLAADHQVAEDPSDPTLSLAYVAGILIATGLMLAAFAYGAQRLIRGFIVGVSAMLAWFVFAEVLPPVFLLGSAHGPALLAAIGVGVALLIYPEWYVIDAAGVLMGAGAAGLFGISFGLLPAIVLLLALAVYDAISVYKTKHMLDLAEDVMELKIPIVLVVPTSLSYSYLAGGSTDGVIEDDPRADAPDAAASSAPSEADGGVDSAETATSVDDSEPASADAEPGDGAADLEAYKRDALFVGLGDAVIPTILVASAASFVDAGTIDVPLIALNAPALGAMAGTIAGLLVLLRMVLRGRPHAGLPLLNGGAIGGYLVGALASGLSLAAALGL